MGFTCDACGVQPAVLYCFAHRQSLCQSCDSRVHIPVRGQPKHERIALTAQRHATQCDICQEDSAVMFCAEDRALICRRCDLMIHTANEFTKVHHRYILSGFAAGLQALDDAQHVSVASASGVPVVPPLPGMPVSASGAMAVPPLPPVPPSLSTRGSEALLDMSATGGPSGATFPGLDGSSAGGGGVSSATGQQQFSNATATNSGAGGSSGDASADRLGSVTLAADLLGMPMLPDNYNAKDVDAAWGDASLGGLDDWSQYLEVPDLGFLDNLDGDFGDSLFPPDLLPLDMGGAAAGGPGPSFEEPNVSVRAPDLVASSVAPTNNPPPANTVPLSDNVPLSNNVPLNITVLPPASLPPAGTTPPPAGVFLSPTGAFLPPAGASLPPAGNTVSPPSLSPAGTFLPPAGKAATPAGKASIVTSGSSESLRQQASGQLPHVLSLPRGMSREMSHAQPTALLPSKMTVTSGDTGSAVPNNKRARMA